MLQAGGTQGRYLCAVKLIGPTFSLLFRHTEMGQVHRLSLSLRPAPPVMLSFQHLFHRYEQVVRILISPLVFLIETNVIVD
jgi:hypothetical protein